MKFALSLAVGGAYSDPRDMSDLASAAEEAGWDAVLLEDYLAYHMHREVPTSDTWMLLAMMATRTPRRIIEVDPTGTDGRRESRNN